MFSNKIQLEADASTFTEEGLHLLIREMRASDYSGYLYMSDLSDATEVSFKEDPQAKPLMEASIELPETILDQLSLGGSNDRSLLRVTSFTLTENTLFVFNENSTVGKALSDGDVMLGNIFIAASLSTPEEVQNLNEPVVIRYIQTEVKERDVILDFLLYHFVDVHIQGLNATNVTGNATCVFWELPTKEGEFQ